MTMVTIRYWAAAKEAAGVADETCEAGTLAEALAAALARRATGPADRLRDVLARSSYLIDGAPAGTRRHEDVTLTGATTIEVLPPFAGG